MTDDLDDELDLLELPDRPAEWSGDARHALDQAIKAGASSEAMAVFARWWELETWLRLLVYLELRARHGLAWTTPLPAAVLAEPDVANKYMPSDDASNPLAYLDAGGLLKLIGEDDVWPLVEYALMRRPRWDGIVVDLIKSVRNRIAHVRRPHRDDLRRVEQTLRDLEPGARLALEAFNRQHWLPKDPLDPLAVAWVDGEHADARRLIKHAERQYDTAFQLSYSVRPWVSLPEEGFISGNPGVLLHASWYLRDGASLAPKAFWNDKDLSIDGVRDLIVVVEHPDAAQVTVTFSGADAPEVVADAIGACFELVLRHRDRRPDKRTRKRWLLDAQGLDWRVHVDTALLVASEDQPFAIFRA